MRFLTIAVVLMAVGLVVSAPAGAASAPKDGDLSGDWMFKCPPVDAKSQNKCYLVQTATIDQDGSKARLLQLTILPQPDHSFILHALLPLGLHIPAGVAIKVDNNDQKPMILQRCTADGCEAAMKLDEALLNQFKKGNSIKIGFNAANGKTVVAPGSLKGFGDALAKLK